MKPRLNDLLPLPKMAVLPLVGACLLVAAFGGPAQALPAQGAQKPTQKAGQKTARKKGVANVKGTFQKLDSNKDGKVSAAEAKAWKIPDAVFKRHDVNGTKSLCPDEFVVLYKYLLIQAGRPVSADLAAEVARIKARRRVRERQKERQKDEQAKEKAKEKEKGKTPVARPKPAPTRQN